MICSSTVLLKLLQDAFSFLRHGYHLAHQSLIQFLHVNLFTSVLVLQNFLAALTLPGPIMNMSLIQCRDSMMCHPSGSSGQLLLEPTVSLGPLRLVSNTMKPNVDPHISPPMTQYCPCSAPHYWVPATWLRPPLLLGLSPNSWPPFCPSLLQWYPSWPIYSRPAFKFSRETSDTLIPKLTSFRASLVS